MADNIVAKASESRYKPHPEGTYTARCVDVIDLGEKRDDWQGTTKILPKVALVFQSGKKNPETGEAFEVSVEFTVSMSDRASLRKFLETWRGKPYTDEQARAGVPIGKLAGQPAMITVGHKTSGTGRTYAKLLAAVPMPEGVAAPELEYQRSEYWAERKREYAEGVARYRHSQDADDALLDDEPPHDDDGMPF